MGFLNKLFGQSLPSPSWYDVQKIFLNAVTMIDVRNVSGVYTESIISYFKERNYQLSAKQLQILKLAESIVIVKPSIRQLAKEVDDAKSPNHFNLNKAEEFFSQLANFGCVFEDESIKTIEEIKKELLENKKKYYFKLND